MIRDSDDRNVKDELYARIQKIFDSRQKVYCGFSGGKDSLVLLYAVYDLILQGKINAKQLSVVFIDEEAIYPCVERVVQDWREKILEVGAAFHWLCLEISHFNCFNQLVNDMSFICWDRNYRGRWIRPIPEYAIVKHPAFKRGMTYQAFMKQITGKHGIQIIGVRAHESVQRRSYLSACGAQHHNYYFPIYDFRLHDVWLCRYENNIEIPEVYVYMWKLGISNEKLRVSQFFSIDTASSLVQMMEYYPELYQKILDREPNAYLAMYYWDTKLFRRDSTSRRAKEQKGKGGEDSPEQLRQEVIRMLAEPPEQLDPKLHKRIQRIVMFYGRMMPDQVWRTILDTMIAGDPKNRNIRAIYNHIRSTSSKFYREENYVK